MIKLLGLKCYVYYDMSVILLVSRSVRPFLIHVQQKQRANFDLWYEYLLF